MLSGAALTTLPAAAWGKKLYKYVDEDGILHYTDREPQTEQPVDAWSVRVEEQPAVTLRREDVSGGIRIHARNRWHGPVQVGLDFTEARNVRSTPSLPADLVIEGFGEAPLLDIEPIDKRQGWEYQLSYLAVPGDPDAAPRAYRYRPPFRTTGRFYIGQAFNGATTHQDDQSRYAVDIGMPVGTPILAARSGVVMHAEEDYFGSGLDPERFAGRANHVRVLHEDGTMALYAHLDLESVSVRPGQTVRTGELLGLSGNTGLSSGPHLHFSVQRNTGLKLVSIPFVFENGTPEGREPRAGEWLTHASER